MIKLSQTDMNRIRTEAFLEELEKQAIWGKIGLKGLKKMFGKKSRKRMMAWARANAPRSGKISKKYKKPVSGKGLNWAQKGVGKIMYKGRQAVKNPYKFLKDDWMDVKYMRRSPSRVGKKGNYTTIFGNKRKVVGYSGGQALIKKKVGGKLLSATVSVPGLTAISYASRPKRDKKGKKISKGKRGVKSVAEGAAWRIAPMPMLAKELYSLRKT